MKVITKTGVFFLLIVDSFGIRTEAHSDEVIRSVGAEVHPASLREVREAHPFSDRVRA
jgi:hypothetical protein